MGTVQMQNMQGFTCLKSSMGLCCTSKHCKQVINSSPHGSKNQLVAYCYLLGGTHNSSQSCHKQE